jgi:hypothetical protein
MEMKEKENEVYVKPFPKYCPACGVKFESLISKEFKA